MLKNVKSVYFIKFIFSYMCDKRMFEIIKYNKSFQNILNINLKDYKLFAGKYMIHDKSGKYKIYTFKDNKLIFNGDYFKGKGREYNNKSELIFEGEYLNGKRNGKGKEYESYSVIFEGEYKDNKKWTGKGLKDNKLIYEIKDGKGIFRKYFKKSNYLLLEGEYINGELNGKCKEYFNSGNLIFEGEYKYGKKWNGKGYDIDGNIIYELNNGKSKGYIKLLNFLDYHMFLKYEGEILNGDKNGYFKEYDFLGNIFFEGEYKNGKKNGKGKEYYSNNLIFEGEYLYDWRIKGKAFINKRLEYEGEYLLNQKWNGKGYDKNGNVIYVINNGSGKAKYYTNEGYLILEGEFLNGKKHGMIKEYNNEHILVSEGEYSNGEKKDFFKNIIVGI